ncbi:hypothetical protein ACFQ7J_02130 [Streptomyces sp. NPDC056501]|uniref:hypothetical protein n=1 Tax=Streptomyces sp. NPDC056501 TaxID=3345841 RepID=UPI0036CA962B
MLSAKKVGPGGWRYDFRSVMVGDGRRPAGKPLRAAQETCVAAHRDCLRNRSPSGMLPEATRLASGRPQDDSAPVGRRAERRKAAHALVHELLGQGHSRRAIARHLGWGLNAVLRYAAAARWQDTFRENRPRP